MNAPAALLTVRWLAWDTFRQALASGVFWVMFAVSALCIVGCLSVGMADVPREPEGASGYRVPATDPQATRPDAPKQAEIVGEHHYSLLFGAVRVGTYNDRETEVRSLQTVLAGGVADTLGVLLALIWTAGFLPSFLEPSAASVLLAKPVPRWGLLVGKYVGVLVFVFVQAGFFVVGTWAALGVRTGVWEPRYLLCLPLMLAHFAVFFSFSAFLAVWSRSAVTCVFGTLLFWMVCAGLNFGRHASFLAFGGPPALLEAGYWALPKPADLGLMLHYAIGAPAPELRLPGLPKLEELGALHLEASLLASLAFAVVVLGLAAYELTHTDY
jgi:hypothetical protein